MIVGVELLLLGTLSKATGESYRQFKFLNNCTETIWVGTQAATFVDSEKGGWEMKPKDTRTVKYPSNVVGARIWGRTGCKGAVGSTFHCDTGDCGPTIACNGKTGATPATLVEYTFHDTPGSLDFYDVSNVDGFNIEMSIEPIPGTFVRHNHSDKYNCGKAECNTDINTHCPDSYLEHKVNGKVVACSSACDHFKTPEFCCPCTPNTPCGQPGCEYGCTEKCHSTFIAKKFKELCPLAYSYAFDDVKSTFACTNDKGTGPDYYITFCPHPH